MVGVTAAKDDGTLESKLQRDARKLGNLKDALLRLVEKFK